MKKIEVFPAVPQGAWGWQAAANFILGGAGTGFYLFSLIVMALEDSSFVLSKQVPYGFLAPVLAAIGFLALTTKPGRPLRGVYLFGNIRQAWVSRETLFWTLFIPVATLDWFIQNPVIRVIAIVLSLAFMISQGAILYQIRAISGWNVFIIPVFFLSSGFASGAGMYLLTGNLSRSSVTLSTILIVLAILSINLVIWLLYLYLYRSKAYREAMERLRRPLNLFITISLGHILPAILLFLFIVWGNESERHFFAEIVVGVAVLLGIIIQKMAIVISASNMKTILIGSSKN